VRGLVRSGTARRQRRSGVAILVVVAAVAVLTIVVTELAYTARVRMLTAAHHRDRVQAEWLARSGFNIYRLILVANKDLARNDALSGMADLIGVNLGDALWQMIPVLNTGMIRMLMGSGGDFDDIDEEELMQFEQTGEVSEEAEEASREGSFFSDRQFLDFDGDFTAEVRDAESRVYINSFSSETSVTQVMDSPTAQRLYALMSGEEADQWFHERNIDRWEVIGNLKDWCDADTYRSSGLGGYEDGLYNTQDPPYLTKNASFDTLDEVRLVEGWQGEVFDRYVDKITIYGKEGKINVNTAENDVIKGIIIGCTDPDPSENELEQCLEELEMSTMLTGGYDKAADFSSAVTTNCGIEMDSACVSANVTFSSQTFNITSTALVGSSEVTIDSVLDFSGRVHEGKLVYWRVR